MYVCKIARHRLTSLPDVDDRPSQFPAFFNGFKNAFQVPGRANMKDLGETMTNVVNQFPDPGLNLVFTSSHDVSRLRSVTSSDTVAYNALVWQFMFDGIPCNYYGE
jgi:alpha-amylase